MSRTRTFTFRSRPEAVSAARRALDGFDELLDLGVFYDASLCVSELVTNAVLHADAPEGCELRLDVAIDDECLRVAVTDPGDGFNPPQPSPGDESGWGLYIVDRLAHRWGVEQGEGTSVWFEMAVSERAGAPEDDGKQRDGDERQAPEQTGERRMSRRRTSPLGLRPQTTL